MSALNPSAFARSAWLLRFTAELRESSRLRLGLMAICAIAWIYGLLVLADARALARERLGQMEDRVATARAEERDRGWPAREAAASRQLAALRTLLWRAPSRSLAEAAFRDWLQNAGQAAGMKIRALAVQTSERSLAKEPAAGPAPAAAAPLPPDVERVRARVTVDFVPQPWANFMLKISSSARVINVERIAIRNNGAQAATAEFDVEALFLLEAAGS